MNRLLYTLAILPALMGMAGCQSARQANQTAASDDMYSTGRRANTPPVVRTTQTTVTEYATDPATTAQAPAQTQQAPAQGSQQQSYDYYQQPSNTSGQQSNYVQPQGGSNSQAPTQVTNNYYGPVNNSNGFGPSMTAFSPLGFYRPWYRPGFSIGFGYSSWGGFSPMMSYSTFCPGVYNPFWYSPASSFYYGYNPYGYFGPSYGFPMVYDPFYNPYFGGGAGYWGYNPGYYGYYNPYYSPYYGGGYSYNGGYTPYQSGDNNPANHRPVVINGPSSRPGSPMGRTGSTPGGRNPGPPVGRPGAGGNLSGGRMGEAPFKGDLMAGRTVNPVGGRTVTPGPAPTPNPGRTAEPSKQAVERQPASNTTGYYGKQATQPVDGMQGRTYEQQPARQQPTAEAVPSGATAHDPARSNVPSYYYRQPDVQQQQAVHTNQAVNQEPVRQAPQQQVYQGYYEQPRSGGYYQQREAEQPTRAYQAPARTYETPARTYEAPARTYQSPSSGRQYSQPQQSQPSRSFQEAPARSNFGGGGSNFGGGGGRSGGGNFGGGGGHTGRVGPR